MAKLTAVSANLRLLNEENRSVCLVSNIKPNAEAERVAAFAGAIEVIYNNGPCSGRLSVVYELER